MHRSSTAAIPINYEIDCSSCLDRAWLDIRAPRPHRAGDSALGIVWTAVTAAVMFALAAAKTTTGRGLANPVLLTEGRVTRLDAWLATAMLTGLALDAIWGAWWADPLAGFVIVFYGLREAYTIFRDHW